MTNKEFFHWVNGYFSLNTAPQVNAREIKILQNHLNLAREVEGYLTKENADLEQLIATFEPQHTEKITQKIKELYTEK